MYSRKCLTALILAALLSIAAVADEPTSSHPNSLLDLTGVYFPPAELITDLRQDIEPVARQQASAQLSDELKGARRWRAVSLDVNAFVATPEGSDNLRGRVQKLGAPLLNVIEITLFPGESIELHNYSVRDGNDGSFSWNGQTDDESVTAQFTISKDNRCFGQIHDTANHRRYTILSIQDSPFHVVMEVDPSSLIGFEQ